LAVLGLSGVVSAASTRSHPTNTNENATGDGLSRIHWRSRRIPPATIAAIRNTKKGRTRSCVAEIPNAAAI